MAFCGDAVSLLHVGDEAADLNYLARKLVADYERRLAPSLRPGVPIVDVHVCAAHSGTSNTNQNLVLTDSGLRDILQLETG
jgi:hypothetical protein